ncbi:hypothetical protein FZEAL_696 [Fusarium zealandicum]|uniref:Myb-like domain-containing protein n=1 Tax=Fusarium zealandicum TaxID=1053134 RepID=A0A8H4UU96_9HYPO|nr:hypothetical protein FZEAL_696 [Fusarium zealandicum]
MSIQPFLDDVEALSRSAGASNSSTNIFSQHPAQPQTPPGSESGSPRVKAEGNFWSSSEIVHSPTNNIGVCPNYQEFAAIPRLQHVDYPLDNSPTRLPSLGEFDQGVEALVRRHGPVNFGAPPSPMPGLPRNPAALQPLRSIAQSQPSWFTDRPMGDLAVDYPTTRRATITNLGQYAVALDDARQSIQSSSNYSNIFGYVGYSMSSPSLHAQGDMDCYPSPPPEGENRHINQKYTTEEGDFIIYAWHDKKMKWQRIKQEFATRFGRTPERTVQGLQAWYYRMNQRIPIWDQDGWLCFDNEDDLEPRHVSIKCRERDSQDKPMEPLGLAQRYPERAVNYAWVDTDLKVKSRDWAAKRALQYRERRERRRRKEQRRLKL